MASRDGTGVAAVALGLSAAERGGLADRSEPAKAGGLDRSLRVLVVDDHPLMRDGIAFVVQSSGRLEVVGQAGDGEEAVRLFRECRPDITLMDVKMPTMNGIDAIAAIRREAPDARIIVLTTYGGDMLALGALKAGASGYLLKTSVRRDLFEAIDVVLSGKRYLPAGVARQIALHAVDEPLTARELVILHLVAAGNANKQIARTLKVADETIKAHLKSVFAKLDVTDRTQAVTVAAKRGIIEL